MWSSLSSGGLRLAATLLAASIILSHHAVYAHTLPEPIPAPSTTIPTPTPFADIVPWPLQPSTTPQPLPLLRTRPYLRRQLAAAEDDHNTICGYIGANPGLPATCLPGSHCVLAPAQGAIGCCPDSGPCTTGIFTGCVDVNSPPQTEINPYVYTCGGSDVCYKNLFDGGYTQFGCGTASQLATSVRSIATGATVDLTSLTIPLTAPVRTVTAPITIGSPTSQPTSGASSPTGSATTTASLSTQTASSTTESSSTIPTTSSSSTLTSGSTSTIATSTSSSTTHSSARGSPTVTNSPSAAPAVENSVSGADKLTGIIAGALCGAAVAVILILAGYVILRRRRRAKRAAAVTGGGDMFPRGDPSGGPSDLPPMASTRYPSTTTGASMGVMRGSPPPRPAAVLGGSIFDDNDRTPLTRPADPYMSGASQPTANPPLWQQNRRHSRNLVWI